MASQIYRDPDHQLNSYINISYIGTDGENEARLFCDYLNQQALIKTNPPVKISTMGAELGVSEMLITIFLTTIVENTLEAIIDYLKKYFRKRQEDSSHININTLNIQIIIKQDDADIGKRYPMKITSKKTPDLEKFFGDIIKEYSKK